MFGFPPPEAPRPPLRSAKQRGQFGLYLLLAGFLLIAALAGVIRAAVAPGFGNWAVSMLIAQFVLVALLVLRPRAEPPRDGEG